MKTTTKPMTAKYAGHCAICSEAFPAGTTIVYNGRASHAECVQAEAARVADEDRATYAFQRKAMADHKAGLRICSTVSGSEIVVTGAPSYAMAKEEAFALVYSIRAAGGSADLLKVTRNGKSFLGRELRSGGYGGTMTYHDGYAFRLRVAA